MKKSVFLLIVVCLSFLLLGGCKKKEDTPKKEKIPIEKEEEIPEEKEEVVVPALPEKEGYVLDWHDEFDGTELDTKKWLTEFLPHNTPVAEGSKANYQVSDGTLKLILDENTVDYYTGKKHRTDGGQIVSGIQTFEKNALHMKDTKRSVETFDGYKTQYGYFEASLKIPRSAGGGSAGFWMVGCEPDVKKNGLGSTQTAEIDIVETFFNTPRKYEPKLHPWSDPDLEEFHEKDVMLPGEDADYHDQFHTYALDWTPERLIFYVDGVEVSRTEQSPQYEMCIFLSVMGSFAPDAWRGPMDGIFPYIFEIDYVRVYKDANGYPNGKTKPTEYQYSGYPMIQSKVYDSGGDPAIELNINDRARHAKLTTLGKHVNSLDFINGIGYEATGGTCTVDNPGLPFTYFFRWHSPQNVNMLNLYSYVANGQGPTVVRVEVQKEGGSWTPAGEYEIEWKLLTATPEYAKLPISYGEGITALKVIVEDANLMWRHYVIQKIHIYKEGEPYDANAAVVSPDYGTGNYALSARVTTNANPDSLINLNDGNSQDTGIWRKGTATEIEGKDYYQLNWSQSISVNKVVLAVTKARNSAPTSLRIEVSKDGQSGWTEVAAARNIKWKELGEVIETQNVEFARQEGIKGIRVWIDKANLVWGGYTILELEVYG